MDFLAKKNFHPRDACITFEEGPHVYTINGDSNYLSVTSWNHSHFSHFDADKIIDKMMSSYRWPQSKYYGKTKDEIKAGWELNGKLASEAGTEMHLNIEKFYNNVLVGDDGKNAIEFKYFEKFNDDYGHLKPYRTEWMIYDEELKFAGSVDMLFENDDGTLEIYDWKRSKEIKMSNRWQSGLTKCVCHLPDCNYYHYSLQLNTYKVLLERNYDVKINGMYLVCLHPNNNNGSYQRIKVDDMSREISDLFRLRERMLEKGIEINNIHDMCDSSDENSSDSSDELDLDEWLGSSSE